MNEAEKRQIVVAEAKSWIGTPYVANGMIKGRRGGVDCAMFPLAVYANCGYIPKEFDPRPYSPQWHVHRNEEKYMKYVRSFSIEVPGPPGRAPLPGDFVLFKIGKLFAHGAIVTEWPFVIHALGDSFVLPEDISKNTTGKRALWLVPKTFFTLWRT